MKKFLASLLAVVLVLGLCACGGNGEEQPSGNKDFSTEGKVKLSIGLPASAMVLDHKNNALTKWVEEQCNVDLEFIEYAGGTDIATQITTTVAARQDLPDILYGVSLGDSTIHRYGRDGYLLDLSKYYEDKENASKTFWERITNELSESDREMVLRKITDPENGAIYCVPTVETSLVDRMKWQLWINQEWLDKLNLKAPTSNEELVTVLKAFRDQDPNGNGQKDEIPLFGSQLVDSAGNSMPVDWIINLFCYYNRARQHNVGADGKLYPVYTTEEYREALKFVNMLYDEKLLTSLAWTADANAMKSITTPSNGTAVCGIFMGHLTLTVAPGSEVLYQYVPMQTWGNVVREDTTCSKATFITESCDNPDKAFEVLMTLWSWEGSMRVRYGEKGVNWDDPDPGAKSDMGLDADYKLLRDANGEQSVAKWSKIASTFNRYAELETAQLTTQTDSWSTKRIEMATASYRLFEEQEAGFNDPAEQCPLLTHTEEEKNAYSMYIANVSDRRDRAQTEFCTGVLDPNKDSDWEDYLKELDKLGLKEYLEYSQTAYDRSKAS